MILAGAVAVLWRQSPALAAPTDTPDNIGQTDGRVSAVVQIGNKIYLAGTFTHVNGVSRSRLAAIDADTGVLTSWNPGANAWVMTLAASPDGTRVYAGGLFGSVGGATRMRIAAINAATGRIDDTWNPWADGAVRSIAVLGDRVYLGGDFSNVNGQARTRLAAVGALNGALDAGWRPMANNTVRKLEISNDGTRVYAGGAFTTISGLSRPNLLRMNPVTGEPSSWRPNPGRPVIDLALSGTRAYTAEGGQGGAAGAYDTITGVAAWRLFGDGDTQAVTVYGNLVYVGGHFDQLGGQSRGKLAAVVPATGALDPQWNPRTDRDVWDLVGDPSRDRLYACGDFTRINGLVRRGITRFSG